MLNRCRLVAVVLLCPLWFPGPAEAQTKPCNVERFQGATLPQGAVAQMHVVNDGNSCSFTVYGLPSEKANPADSGSITSQAKHGTVKYEAPDARYVPAPGYAGPDEFELQAFARGRGEQPYRIRVRVQVTVSLPNGN